MCQASDPFVTYLKQFGYNTIRLPRANIKPLQLLARSGRDLNWLGDLSDVFVSPEAHPLPAVQLDVDAANIAGQRTGDLSIGVGLSILGNIIGALGGSKLGVEVAYKQARSAVFEFPEVKSDVSNLAQLDQFLGRSDVNPASVAVSKMLEADQVYVITNTLKSRKFTMEAKRSNGTSVGVDVPVIQGAVGGSVAVSVNATQDGKVTYEGATPLVFGFQAVRLFYENNAYTTFKPLGAGSISARALSLVPDDGTDRLMTEETFVRLSGA